MVFKDVPLSQPSCCWRSSDWSLASLAGLCCFLCYLTLPSFTTMVPLEPTHSSDVLWAGRGGWVLYPPPPKLLFVSHQNPALMRAAGVGSKTASGMWPDLFMEGLYLPALSFLKDSSSSCRNLAGARQCGVSLWSCTEHHLNVTRDPMGVPSHRL